MASSLRDSFAFPRLSLLHRFDALQNFGKRQVLKPFPPLGRVIAGARVILLEKPNRVGGPEAVDQRAESLTPKFYRTERPNPS